jgi:hypothetical protein
VIRPEVEAVHDPSLSTQIPPNPICRPAKLLVVPSPIVVVPKAETVKTEDPEFWKSRYLELVLANDPEVFPKFISRPVPVKAEVSWNRARRLAEVIVSLYPRIAFP